jgi:hypothetical protein
LIQLSGAAHGVYVFGYISWTRLRFYVTVCA